MSILNTASFNDLVANKDVFFNKGANSVEPAAFKSGLYKTDTWGQGTGDTREYSEIDLEQYASRKPEGDDASTAKVQQGYSKTVKPFRFAKDIQITWEMRDYNKYQSVVTQLTAMGYLVANRLELDLQHRFTFGTATTYTDMDGFVVDITTGDGLALFSTVHTLTGSSTTYRNRLAGNPQLSRGSIEAMEKMLVENTLNNFGQKMALTYDVLWVTDDPNTNNTARELMQSTAEVSAPNAGVVNVYKAKYRIVRLPLVATTPTGQVDSTKAKYWGIAASGLIGAEGYCSIAEAPHMTAPQAGTNQDNASTDDWVFCGRATYAIVWVIGRGVALSTGDGAA